MPSLSTRVIQKALQKHHLPTDLLASTSSLLDTEYGLAEAIDAAHVDLEETDMVILLSGRSGFEGAYLEAADKYMLCANEYDATDTLRRMAHGINIAKQCTLKNLEKGVTKPVYVFFNGVKAQNNELRQLLRTRGELFGYPARFFIIDAIPFDNTLGQVLSLSRYLDEQWPIFCKLYNLSRSPNLVICTSSYHVPRVSLAHGANSPLLTAEFWTKHPDMVKKLTSSMRNYVLNPGLVLKESSLVVLGCDRQISANAFWEKDLQNDMEARICYSYLQAVPTIAKERADNDKTVRSALALVTLYRRNRSIFFDGTPKPQDVQKKSNDTKNECSLMVWEDSQAVMKGLR